MRLILEIGALERCLKVSVRGLQKAIDFSKQRARRSD